MKKIYLTAEMTIVALRNQDLIVTSGFGMSGGTSDSDIEEINDGNKTGYDFSW